MRVIVLQREIVVAKREQIVHVRIDAHDGQRARRAAELFTRLIEMVRIQMRVAQRVDEIAVTQIAHLRDHHRQQCVRRNIKWHAQKDIRAALVELAGENKLRALLPARVAYSLTRWKNVLYGMWIYALSRSKPDAVRDKLLSLARAELGPDYDIATHLTPRYNPWDQRLCLVPDSDLFKALKANSAEIMTDQIDRFNQHGIALKSGKQLHADLIITATGLDLKLLGGMAISVDGARVELPATISYKGMMFSGVPNLASSFGYTNASWTLRADLICEYVCRLLNHMERTGTRQCTPRLNDPSVTAQDWVSLTSGYFQRSQHKLPKQGSKAPWQARQNYVSDLLNIKFARVDDGVMEFGNAIDHLRNKTVSMT